VKQHRVRHPERWIIRALFAILLLIALLAVCR
jgi:hypothetical protein